MISIRAFILVIVVLWQVLPGIAQNEDVKYDYNWYLGYAGSTGLPKFGPSILSFDEEEVFVSTGNHVNMNFSETNITISDAYGNITFYSNGAYVFDASHSLMQGGDTLSPSEYTTDKYIVGHYLPQGVLALPHPGDDSKWHLFHNYAAINQTGIAVVAPEKFHSTIDMTLNGGLGAVNNANEVFLSGEFSTRENTACRHANGRDWWLLFPEIITNKVHRYLLDLDGLHYIGTQEIGEVVMHGLKQAVFSPDGTTYVRFNTEIAPTYSEVNIFDFDRCTGMLSNPINISYEENFGAGGCEISPSSQYLYVSAGNKIFQYDLWSDDIASTLDTVAVYDGGTSNGFPTFFYTCQHAPDGKIYITNTSTVFTIHVIHDPDSAGTACNVEQQGIELPYLQEGLPNNPHYRLGRLVGSACDTIDFTSSVAEIEVEQGVTFYPNPTYGELQVRLSAPEVLSRRVAFELYDMAGRQLYTVPLREAEQSVTLPEVAAGMYVGRVIDAEGAVIAVEKLVVIGYD